MKAMSASQSLAAVSTSVSSTGCRSNFGLCQSCDVGELFPAQNTAMRTARRRSKRHLRHELGEPVGQTVQTHSVKILAVERPKHAESGLAEVRRLFQHRVKYRREVSGGGINDLEDFGHCGFLRLGFVALQERLVEPPFQI